MWALIALFPLEKEIASGTAGDVLVSNGGSPPAWANPGGSQFDGTFWRVGGNTLGSGVYNLGVDVSSNGDLKVFAGGSKCLFFDHTSTIGISTTTPLKPATRESPTKTSSLS